MAWAMHRGPIMRSSLCFAALSLFLGLAAASPALADEEEDPSTTVRRILGESREVTQDLPEASRVDAPAGQREPTHAGFRGDA